MAKKKWIQGAIKRPGALGKKAKALGCMNKDGTIDLACMARKAGDDPTTKRQIALAKTLRKLR